MTAEEWDNAARNSWLINVGRKNLPITNGYSTTPPQYNPYWSQQAIPYRRADYTQPMQNVTPPINQALNENFQPQDTIRFSNYNGQPVSVPANKNLNAWDVLADAGQWVGTQATENLLTKGFTGKTLGEWAGIGARKLGTKAAGSLMGGPFGTAIAWAPEAVDLAKYLVNTPTAKSIGRGIQHLINWGF